MFHSHLLRSGERFRFNFGPLCWRRWFGGYMDFGHLTSLCVFRGRRHVLEVVVVLH